jgi:rhodanese-related sulfurtransferase
MFFRSSRHTNTSNTTNSSSTNNINKNVSSTNHHNNNTTTTTESRREIALIEDALRREMTKRNATKEKVCELVLELKRNGANLSEDLRLPTWRFMLGAMPLLPRADPISSRNIIGVENTEINQQVIWVDVERTRVDVPQFRTSHTKHTLSSLLTYFVKSRNIKYKQGLNELVAPFMWLHRNRINNPITNSSTMANYSSNNNEDSPKKNTSTITATTTTTTELLPQDTESSVLETFSLFIDRFIPHLYLDDDMLALQCSCRLFELLLLFHDPDLKKTLEHTGLRPELYASGFFMTLFAQSLPLDKLYILWDAFIFYEHGDKLQFFIALSFLCGNRAPFLKADSSDLPVLLTSRLSFHRRSPITTTTSTTTSTTTTSNATTTNNQSIHEVQLLADSLPETLRIAQELCVRTPESFLRDINTILLSKSSPPHPLLIKQLENRTCLTISPLELLRKLDCMIIIDVREQQEYNKQHVIKSLNWHQDILNSPTELTTAFAHLLALRSKRLLKKSSNPRQPPSLDTDRPLWVCVLGNSSGITTTSSRTSTFSSEIQDQPTGVCVLHLIQRNVPCICVIEGGFNSLLEVCTASRNFSALTGGNIPSNNNSSIMPPPSSQITSGVNKKKSSRNSVGGNDTSTTKRSESAVPVPVHLIVTRRPIGGG